MFSLSRCSSWSPGVVSSGFIATFEDSLMGVEGTNPLPLLKNKKEKYIELLICHYLNKEGLCHFFMNYYNEIESTIWIETEINTFFQKLHIAGGRNKKHEYFWYTLYESIRVHPYRILQTFLKFCLWLQGLVYFFCNYLQFIKIVNEVYFIDLKVNFCIKKKVVSIKNKLVKSTASGCTPMPNKSNTC